MTLLTLFNRRWWWATMLIIAGMFLLAWLGFWQLDRLAQRRAANQILIGQIETPPILINEADPDSERPLEFIQAKVIGKYDTSYQVELVQQRFREQVGRHLITPLIIDARDEAILVDRGWIPENGADIAGWPDFVEDRQVEVIGYLKPTEKLPNGREPTIPQSWQQEWFRVEIPGIQAQTPYELLPYYILAAPPDGYIDDGTGLLPFPQEPQFDLSEGSHLSYAIQWFSFSLMLAVTYILIVKKNQPHEEQVSKFEG